MDVGGSGRNGSIGGELTQLFVEQRDRLVGTAYFVLGSTEDARDAVQEAFVKCWRAKERAEIGHLSAWVHTVVLNSAKDWRRRRRLRRTESLPNDDAMPPARRGSAPGADAERADTVARVRIELRGLPEAEREVFLLRQNGECTFEAIAGALGIPVGTAKTRMRNALRRLRAAFDVRRPAINIASEGA